MPAATNRQLNFIDTLLCERVIDGDPAGWKTAARSLDRKGASAWIAELLRRPRLAAPEQTRLETGTVEVPAGKYALERVGGDAMFVQVDRPTRGRWAGRTFVSTLHGPNHSPVRDAGRRSLLLAEIADDVEGALRRFGRLTSRCGVCGLQLTDRFSAFYGVGPVCRSRHGMPKSEADYKRKGGSMPELTDPEDVPREEGGFHDPAWDGDDRLREKAAVQQRERIEDVEVAIAKGRRDGFDTSELEGHLVELREAEQS